MGNFDKKNKTLHEIDRDIAKCRYYMGVLMDLITQNACESFHSIHIQQQNLINIKKMFDKIESQLKQTNADLLDWKKSNLKISKRTNQHLDETSKNLIIANAYLKYYHNEFEKSQKITTTKSIKPSFTTPKIFEQNNNERTK